MKLTDFVNMDNGAALYTYEYKILDNNCVVYYLYKVFFKEEYKGIISCVNRGVIRYYSPSLLFGTPEGAWEELKIALLGLKVIRIKDISDAIDRVVSNSTMPLVLV